MSAWALDDDNLNLFKCAVHVFKKAHKIQPDSSDFSCGLYTHDGLFYPNQGHHNVFTSMNSVLYLSFTPSLFAGFPVVSISTAPAEQLTSTQKTAPQSKARMCGRIEGSTSALNEFHSFEPFRKFMVSNLKYACF